MVTQHFSRKKSFLLNNTYSITLVQNKFSLKKTFSPPQKKLYQQQKSLFKEYLIYKKIHILKKVLLKIDAFVSGCP